MYWLTYLSKLEMALDNHEKARELLGRALDIEERFEGRHTTRVGETLMHLGSLWRGQEDFTRARSLFEEALAIDTRSYGPSHQRVLSTLGRLGDLHVAMGDYTRGRDFLVRSIQGTERTLGPDHHGLAAPLSSYGRLLLAEGEPAEALIQFERALRVREKALGRRRHYEIAESLADIAQSKLRLEGSAAAEPLLRRALAMQRDVLAPGHRSLVPTLTALGEVLAAVNKRAEARALLEEAVRIASARLPSHHSTRVRAEQALDREEAERPKVQRR